MSELTREEVRRACEAVGWEWNEPKGAKRGDTAAWATGGCDLTERFQTMVGEEVWGDVDDAIALLEATGLEWQVNRYRDPKDIEIWGEFDVVLDEYSRGGSDFPTAAVRAVNAWAEERAAKGAP